MQTEHNVKLTASEISQLWSAYMNSSMSKCIFKYFLETVEDNQIRSILEQSLELADAHLKKLSEIFNKESYPIPQGFNVKNDVNMTAPKLFSDSFVLYFIKSMDEIALSFYAASKVLVVRSDIDQYFSECLTEMNKFDTVVKDVLLSKGLFIRSPYLNPPNEVRFVEQQNFLAGWFGKQRPLTAIEITNIFANLQRNALGIITMLGFSQVAKSAEVARFMARGKEIASKHVEIFGSLLKENDLPVPMAWASNVTASKIPPFSDKMMMFMTTALIALSIGFYGASMSVSARRDIAFHYVRLTAEIGEYAEDGANIMIKNGWLEEPPLSEDRNKLANHKKG
ncbi:DUF3231 family protein [Bacillus sp. CMF21]|uniref:DUF3231 family protein n=1 Tax=Metabacillus dongyingensis TaxID=2874282 RepID=UPI001CBD6F5F|nr:DUF3231 family protein [Metabacillus dongyingensis]UAL53532.1 DUF3231 family protein [Metabacillus dongyingensis]USK29843.1 DUF3231 family protein [Bacillus sp. CMF21]